MIKKQDIDVIINLDDIDKIDSDYGELKYFNKVLKELELFSKVNNLDLDIKIFDKTNNNTKFVVEIEQ